jgi:hypothetical protein
MTWACGQGMAGQGDGLSLLYVSIAGGVRHTGMSTWRAASLPFACIDMWWT